MSLQRYEQIDKIFQSAVELTEDHRAAFLDRACAGDAELRKEVETLLAYDERAQGFIESPVFEEAPELLADDPTSTDAAMTMRKVSSDQSCSSAIKSVMKLPVLLKRCASLRRR